VFEKKLVDVPAVTVRPPLKSIKDVVALCPAAGCVHASYAEMPFADPQAEPVEERIPVALNCAHVVPELPAEETTRFVELAVVAVIAVEDA
jgi:hypothetical protein